MPVDSPSFRSGHPPVIQGAGAGGSIPSNVTEAPLPDLPETMLAMGNNAANDAYTQRCKQAGMKIHPARFPALLPKFFIKMLTDPGDLVLDPFAGSNTTGIVCEELGRRWIAIEAKITWRPASFGFMLHQPKRPPRSSSHALLRESRSTRQVASTGWGRSCFPGPARRNFRREPGRSPANVACNLGPGMCLTGVSGGVDSALYVVATGISAPLVSALRRSGVLYRPLFSPLRIAGMTQGLRRPCMTATTRNRLFSGAQAMS